MEIEGLLIIVYLNFTINFILRLAAQRGVGLPNSLNAWRKGGRLFRETTSTGTLRRENFSKLLALSLGRRLAIFGLRLLLLKELEDLQLLVLKEVYQVKIFLRRAVH